MGAIYDGNLTIALHKRRDGLRSEVDATAAGDVLGPAGGFEVTVPSAGAENFGAAGAVLPTSMLRVGVRGPGHPTRHLHTPTFDVDERAIGVAMRVMGRAILATFDAIPPGEHR